MATCVAWEVSPFLLGKSLSKLRQGRIWSAECWASFSGTSFVCPAGTAASPRSGSHSDAGLGTSGCFLLKFPLFFFFLLSSPSLYLSLFHQLAPCLDSRKCQPTHPLFKVHNDITRLEGIPGSKVCAKLASDTVIPPGFASYLAQVGSPWQRTLPVRPLPVRPLPEPQCSGWQSFPVKSPTPAQPRPAELLWVPVVPERPQSPGQGRLWSWPSPLPVFRPSSLPHFRRVFAQMLLSDLPCPSLFLMALVKLTSSCLWHQTLFFELFFAAVFAVPTTAPDPLLLPVKWLFVSEWMNEHLCFSLNVHGERELHTHSRLGGSVGGSLGAWLLDYPCEPECVI